MDYLSRTRRRKRHRDTRPLSIPRLPSRVRDAHRISLSCHILVLQLPQRISKGQYNNARHFNPSSSREPKEGRESYGISTFRAYPDIFCASPRYQVILNFVRIANGGGIKKDRERERDDQIALGLKSDLAGRAIFRSPERRYKTRP